MGGNISGHAQTGPGRIGEDLERLSKTKSHPVKTENRLTDVKNVITTKDGKCERCVSLS